MEKQNQTNLSLYHKIKHHPVSWIILHILIWLTLYLVFSFMGFIEGVPDNIKVINWDAGWYKDIVDNGYSLREKGQSNVAFYPLFPYMWKYLGLQGIGISVFNLFLMLFGMLMLKKTFKFDNYTMLIFLSIPSMFFNFIPFSEALFFFWGALAIYGLKYNYIWTVIGIFFMGLSRSASMIFIPMILFMQCMAIDFKRFDKSDVKVLIQAIWMLLAAAISWLVVQYIQYVATGEFFVMFEVQKSWGRGFSYPKLFLTTYDEGRLVWLDGFAYLVGLFAVILCFKVVLKKYKDLSHQFRPYILISFAYLTMIFLIVSFFSPSTTGTQIMSANRYVFATPFFTVFLIFLFERSRLEKHVILTYFITSLIVWGAFGGVFKLHYLDQYVLPSKTQIYFLILIAYGFLYLLFSDKKYKMTVWSGLYLFNVVVQIFLFNTWLNDIFVG